MQSAGVGSADDGGEEEALATTGAVGSVGRKEETTTTSGTAHDGNTMTTRGVRNDGGDARRHDDCAAVAPNGFDVVRKIGGDSIVGTYLIREKAGEEDGEAKNGNEDATSRGTSCPSAEYVLKRIDLDRVGTRERLDDVKGMIAILKAVDHPNIVRARRVLHHGDDGDGDGAVSIVLERCTGGDLRRRAPYAEGEARAVVAQILDAVNYLHGLGIMHRNLKFEVKKEYFISFSAILDLLSGSNGLDLFARFALVLGSNRMVSRDLP